MCVDQVTELDAHDSKIVHEEYGIYISIIFLIDSYISDIISIWKLGLCEVAPSFWRCRHIQTHGVWTS